MAYRPPKRRRNRTAIVAGTVEAANTLMYKTIVTTNPDGTKGSKKILVPSNHIDPQPPTSAPPTPSTSLLPNDPLEHDWQPPEQDFEILPRKSKVIII